MIMKWIKRAVEQIARKLIKENDEEKSYCYVFVRKDIPIWAQMVQVGHACLGAGETFHDSFPRKNVNIILLSVLDREELDYALQVAGSQGVRCFAFYEQDEDSLGGEVNPGFTAACTEPLDGEKWKCVFDDFDLWEVRVG